MHLADGILSGPTLAGGTGLALIGVALGLRRTDYAHIPQMAVLSAAFFVSSLIHIPLGPSQVHLMLTGLVGMILGWGAFPALLVALFLQAVLFGYGGITALGVNTFNMAFPAVLCWYLTQPLLRRRPSLPLYFASGCAAGAFALLANALLLAASLYLSDREYWGALSAIFVTQLPLLFIEGPLTGAAALFLAKTKPELLQGGRFNADQY